MCWMFLPFFMREIIGMEKRATPFLPRVPQ